MFFDSPYYLQSSVGLEALYYRAAIELLQYDCELGAMEMMCRAIPDDKLKKTDLVDVQDMLESWRSGAIYASKSDIECVFSVIRRLLNVIHGL